MRAKPTNITATAAAAREPVDNPITHRRAIKQRLVEALTRKEASEKTIAATAEAALAAQTRAQESAAAVEIARASAADYITVYNAYQEAIKKDEITAKEAWDAKEAYLEAQDAYLTASTTGGADDIAAKAALLEAAKTKLEESAAAAAQAAAARNRAARITAQCDHAKYIAYLEAIKIARVAAEIAEIAEKATKSAETAVTINAAVAAEVVSLEAERDRNLKNAWIALLSVEPIDTSACLAFWAEDTADQAENEKIILELINDDHFNVEQLESIQALAIAQGLTSIQTASETKKLSYLIAAERAARARTATMAVVLSPASSSLTAAAPTTSTLASITSTVTSFFGTARATATNAAVTASAAASNSTAAAIAAAMIGPPSGGTG